MEEVDPADGYSIINASETVYISDNGTQSDITVRFDNALDGILLIRKVCAVNPCDTVFHIGHNEIGLDFGLIEQGRRLDRVNDIDGKHDGLTVLFLLSSAFTASRAGAASIHAWDGVLHDDSSRPEFR